MSAYRTELEAFLTISLSVAALPALGFLALSLGLVPEVATALASAPLLWSAGRLWAEP